MDARSQDAASTDDFARYCCGDPDCPNDCEREQPPSAAKRQEFPPDPLFAVPAVKKALFLLLGGGLDDEGKEKWLASRIERGIDAEYVFGEALEMLGGMVAT